MKYDSQFRFLIQGNVISILGAVPEEDQEIQGAVPEEHQETQFLVFDQLSRFGEVSLSDEKAEIMYRAAKKGGLLKGLKECPIPESDHCFPWRFQYAHSILTQEASEPAIYVRADVQSYLDRLLWEPLEAQIKKELKQFPAVIVELPIFPTVLRHSFMVKWYANNQAAGAYFDRRRKFVSGYNRAHEKQVARSRERERS